MGFGLLVSFVFVFHFFSTFRVFFYLSELWSLEELTKGKFEKSVAFSLIKLLVIAVVLFATLPYLLTLIVTSQPLYFINSTGRNSHVKLLLCKFHWLLFGLHWLPVSACIYFNTSWLQFALRLWLAEPLHISDIFIPEALLNQHNQNISSPSCDSYILQIVTFCSLYDACVLQVAPLCLKLFVHCAVCGICCAIQICLIDMIQLKLSFF